MNARSKGSLKSGGTQPVKEPDTKDILSGLFNEKTAKQYISQRLKKMTRSDICALFVIDIDRLDAINDACGRTAGDRVVRHTGQILSSLFRATDIIGRLQEDAFVVFLTGAVSEEAVFEKANLLCRMLHFFAAPDRKYRATACVGVYLASGRGLLYDDLYAGAVNALAEAKKHGAGSFYLSGAESGLLPDRRMGVSAYSAILPVRTLLENMDDGVCLLEAADPIRIAYASPGFCRMLGLDRSSMRFPCPLHEIGIHPDYEADYERTLKSLTQKSGPAEHIHKISGARNGWIWRQVRVSRISCRGSDYPVLLEVSRDISDLIEARQQLQENCERLRVAFGQTQNILWEVDLSSKTFSLFDVNTQSCAPGTALSDFPESLLDNGIIHPDSVDNFRLFAAGILDGKAGDTGNFIIKDPKNDCYGWFSLSYRQTYDGDQNPVKAVGIQERLPSVSGVYSVDFFRRPIPETLRHHLVARLCANLSKDVIEELWMDGIDHTSRARGSSYSESRLVKEPFLFLRMDKEEFANFFSREQLLEAYRQGEFWSSSDCRWIDGGGNIRWLTGTVNLLRSSKTGDIHLFACFCDTQMRHEWEQMLETGAERDPVSGLYSPQTAKALSELLIASGTGSSSLCALALIRICGSYTRLLNQDVPDASRKRRFLSIALSFALGTDCIVGQQEADTLLVFFPKAVSRFDVKKRIEDAFAYVRIVMEDFPDIDAVRFISCAVTERLEDADYGLLLSRASCLCGLWKNAAMDMVAFPDDEEDWTWAGLGRESESGGIPVQLQEVERPLSAEEQRIAFDCAAAMLTSASLRASMENVLRHLGNYYKAARVYILSLSNSRQTVTMLYEWTGPRKYSIQHVMSGMQIEKFPLLQRCLNEKVPIFIKSSGENFGTREEGKFWHFTVFPLKVHNDIEGFLCVENAQEHPEEAALIGTLLPYIIQEQRRYQGLSAGLSASGQDVLSRLPNLRSYLNMIGSLNSDVYSSMGALSLDVPNLSALNGSKGYDYGRELLEYTAETLSDVFGKAFLFRTWDAEFVVLYPNTIQEVFTSRCTRLRTMLQRRYPGQLRIGYTWADGVFTARNLVKEAQSIMHCENVQKDPGERFAFLNGTRTGIQKAASEGSFLAYFQPKIDMRDGSLAGAEALVRGVDKAGHIIPPAQFIETLEKNGSIRELDLMMLERVLEQLSEWKKQGLPPVNVSVNISRFTLFNPTTLASILAIQSHYPDIPSEQVELEITETAGDIEKATLASIVEQFQEFGLRFELDDFGSRYANMSIFSNIRFNTIKLDRSLINELPGNEISRMLVENIVRICQNVGMHCVAEGVETRQQEAALLNAGCIYAQGYYYARPLPPRKFEEQYLKQNQSKG